MNQNDLTPHLPPFAAEFEHSGREIFIMDSEGATVECLTDVEQDGNESKECSNSYAFHSIKRHGTAWNERIGYKSCFKNEFEKNTRMTEHTQSDTNQEDVIKKLDKGKGKLVAPPIPDVSQIEEEEEEEGFDPTLQEQEDLDEDEETDDSENEQNVSESESDLEEVMNLEKVL